MSRPLGRVGYLPRSIVVLPALLRERDAPDTAGKMPALRTSLSLYFANLNKSLSPPLNRGLFVLDSSFHPRLPINVVGKCASMLPLRAPFIYRQNSIPA